MNLPLPDQFRLKAIDGQHYVMACFNGDESQPWAGPFGCRIAAELARERHVDLNRMTREYGESVVV